MSTIGNEIQIENIFLHCHIERQTFAAPQNCARKIRIKIANKQILPRCQVHTCSIRCYRSSGAPGNHVTQSQEMCMQLPAEPRTPTGSCTPPCRHVFGAGNKGVKSNSCFPGQAGTWQSCRVDCTRHV